MPATYRKTLLGTALLLGSCLLSPLVFAHAHLKSETPAADATVDAPSELRLVFSEGVEPSFSAVTLTGSDGQKVALQPLRTAAGDQKTLIAAPTAPLAAGQYKVEWQALSVDTHKSNGTYNFKVGQ